MLTRLRRIGNSVGLSLPQKILELAGFVEGQEVMVTAKLGTITIVSEAQVQIGLTLDEAKALVDGVQDSPAAQSAREKIRDQLGKNNGKKD